MSDDIATPQTLSLCYTIVWNIHVRKKWPQTKRCRVIILLQIYWWLSVQLKEFTSRVNLVKF